MVLTDCIGKLQLELIMHITATKTTEDTHALLNSTNRRYQSAAVLTSDKKLTSYKVKQAAKISQGNPWGIVSCSQTVESSNRGRVSNALQGTTVEWNSPPVKQRHVKLELSSINVTREWCKITHSLPDRDNERARVNRMSQ
jgi:hypothetical protein